jgi:hypothetical protein
MLVETPDRVPRFLRSPGAAVLGRGLWASVVAAAAACGEGGRADESDSGVSLTGISVGAGSTS